MKPRNWSLDAYELARQTNSPGCVALIERAMSFGYGLGIKDATEEMSELRKRINKAREVGNKPT